MPLDSPSFFLITGGPGVGKTALIAELRARGERCVDETHRRVIREQAAGGGTALPWRDRAAYQALTAREDILIYKAMCAGEPRRTFFDRGIIDSLPAPEDGPAPAWMEEAARTLRYNRKVFVPPPWPQIYVTDAERKQSFEECLATHDVIIERLIALGYQPVEVPPGEVGARADFVLAEAR